MSHLSAIADRVEIQALRGGFADAAMMHDYDRFASLFTHDGAWRIPPGGIDIVGRKKIRAAIEQMQGHWDYFVQTTHPGAIQLAGYTAAGRAYICEFGHLRNGSSQLHYSLYHDRYQRTPDGWKFAERVYEVRYLGPSPLAGLAPHRAGNAPCISASGEGPALSRAAGCKFVARCLCGRVLLSAPACAPGAWPEVRKMAITAPRMATATQLSSAALTAAGAPRLPVSCHTPETTAIPSPMPSR